MDNGLHLLKECYTTKIKCNYKLFKNYNEYKKQYNILDTWQDINEKIINTWQAPEIINQVNAINATALTTTTKALIDHHVKNIPNSVMNTHEAIKDTLNYMFNKYDNCIYVRIRNGKIANYYYICSKNYSNPLWNYFEIKNKKYPEAEKKKWINLDGVIKTFEKTYDEYGITFHVIDIYKYLHDITSKNKINDTDFIINFRDRLILKNNLTEPSEEIVGRTDQAIPSNIAPKATIPIYSFCSSPSYTDISFITIDDIKRITKVFTPPDCNNNYKKEIAKKDWVKWGSRQDIAIFRGSFTGNSINWVRNQRLNLMNQKTQYPGEIDAGFTSIQGFKRGRKEMGSPYIEFISKNELVKHSIKPLTYMEQMKYKYNIYVEGNVAAFRGSYLFALGSVVIWIQSKKYQLWFEPLLEDKKNCIIIKPDLSDLHDSILWLRNNDARAKKIAESGYKLYTTVLSKKELNSYVIGLLNYSSY